MGVGGWRGTERKRGRGVCLREMVNSGREEDKKREFLDLGLNSTQKTS